MSQPHDGSRAAFPPSYTDASTGHVLRWITDHHGVKYLGVWAIISELGTGDILSVAQDPSPRCQHGPSNLAMWLTPDDATSPSSTWRINVYMRVFDAVGVAEIVARPSVLIGDNITAKKRATIDTVTPGNKHIRIAYHWIKEHVRDLDIDL